MTLRFLPGTQFDVTFNDTTFATNATIHIIICVSNHASSLLIAAFDLSKPNSALYYASSEPGLDQYPIASTANSRRIS